MQKNTQNNETIEKSPKRILGLPKNIFFLGLTSFFNDFSSEMVFSIFPAFFTSVLKAGAGALGLVDGIAEAFSNFFKVYSGNLSDKFQKRKPFVVSGYILSVITRPFYILVSGVGGALGLRVIDRIGKGLRDAPRDAIISLSTPKEELGKSFGYHRAMDTAGSILGPLVAYFILKNFPLNFNLVFGTAFIVGIIAVLSLLFIKDVLIKVSGRRAGIIDSFRQLSGQFKLFLFSIFILSIGSLPVAVMLLKTQSIGLTIADIPLFYMIYSISYTVFSISAGRISDRVGTKKVILMGYLILLISYFLIAGAQTFWALAISFLVLGLFPALTDGVQRSLASQLVPAEIRGGALGSLNATTGLGALLAGILGGFIWQAFGANVAFLVAGIFITLGIIIFSFFNQKTSSTKKSD